MSYRTFDEYRTQLELHKDLVWIVVQCDSTLGTFVFTPRITLRLVKEIQWYSVHLTYTIEVNTANRKRIHYVMHRSFSVTKSCSILEWSRLFSPPKGFVPLRVVCRQHFIEYNLHYKGQREKTRFLQRVVCQIVPLEFRIQEPMGLMAPKPASLYSQNAWEISGYPT